MPGPCPEPQRPAAGAPGPAQAGWLAAAAQTAGLDEYDLAGVATAARRLASWAQSVWVRLRHKPLPRPAGREWAWLTGLAVIGLAGCSVLLIEATRVADPASVGIIIGGPRWSSSSQPRSRQATVPAAGSSSPQPW